MSVLIWILMVDDGKGVLRMVCPVVMDASTVARVGLSIRDI